MTFDDETPFEEAMIQALVANGWKDGIINYPSEEQLVLNWADKLFANNSSIDRLNDQPLTQGEMRQVMEMVRNLRTPLALNGFINGKSVTITRDNPADPLHLGKEVKLAIYDRLQIAGGKSTYQIARQPRFERHTHILPKRRGDFVLLINGMPVIHVELKSSKVSARQAANQIQNYSHEGVFSDGIFSLVQIFVAMNPEETLYFANPGRDGTFNPDYFFHWADSRNNLINDWSKIASDLLSIPKAHQLTGFYTVADNSDGVLKVMRSYQYYAASSISNAVSKWNWERGGQQGGYVWHTTGSGKTMTSFKAAQLIASSGDADKVVFLVDRIELGTQSLDEYRSFADSVDDVQATESTDILVSKLSDDEDKRNRLIVTSIQKLSRVNEEQGRKRKRDLEKIQTMRLVIIVDECHRSTFGDMLVAIKQTFPRAVFFGFTGTPIKEENQKKLNTTQTIFGKELHNYTIANGIIDGNVLGFDKYMVTTYTDKQLRRAVALEKAHADSEAEALADEQRRKTYLHYMNAKEVGMAGHKEADGSYTKGIEDYVPRSQYNRDEHRRCVVKNIRDSWLTQSVGGKFHALLATESIPEAICYYRLFREMMPELRVTALFDPNIDNTGGQEFKEDGLVEILEGYNKTFGKEYTMPTHSLFKKDVSLRLAHKKPYNSKDYTPDKQINLLIVVNQMLTGFDSKWINTLYVDKLMEYENIIQAFSRTNRIFGPEKPFGTIRYYRYPHTMERNIEEAVRVYSDNKPLKLFANPLLHNLQQLNNLYGEIKYVFEHAGITNFERLPLLDADRAQFAKLFAQLNKYLEVAKLQGFQWKTLHYRLRQPNGKYDEIDVLLDETTYLMLCQRYKELLPGTGGGGGVEEPPYDIETYLTEIDTGQIDADYINERFNIYLKVQQKGNATEEERQAVMEDLHHSFAMLSQEEQKYANIFLHDVESGEARLDSGKKFKDYVVEYMTRAKNTKVHQVAEAFGVDEQLLFDFMTSDVTNQNINAYNRLSQLMATVSRDKALHVLEKVEKKKLPPFRVRSKAELFFKEFILSKGEMDISIIQMLGNVEDCDGMAEFIDTMMTIENGTTILRIQAECITRFGEQYGGMSVGDWYRIINAYVGKKTQRYDLKPEETFYWQAAESSPEQGQRMEV